MPIIEREVKLISDEDYEWLLGKWSVTDILSPYTGEVLLKKDYQFNESDVAKIKADHVDTVKVRFRIKPAVKMLEKLNETINNLNQQWVDGLLHDNELINAIVLESDVVRNNMLAIKEYELKNIQDEINSLS